GFGTLRADDAGRGGGLPDAWAGRGRDVLPRDAVVPAPGCRRRRRGAGQDSNPRRPGARRLGELLGHRLAALATKSRAWEDPDVLVLLANGRRSGAGAVCRRRGRRRRGGTVNGSTSTHRGLASACPGRWFAVGTTLVLA